MSKVIGGEFAIDAVAAYQILRQNNIESSPSKKYGKKYFWEESGTFIKYYSSGRTALFSILQSIAQTKMGGVLLPDYLCDSVTQTVIESNTDYSFYHVDNNLYPNETLYERIDKMHAAVLLINYFGLLDLTDVVKRIRNSAPNVFIILDEVQNLYDFTKESDFDYAFTSFRKWLPVPDGAVVSVKNKELWELLPEYKDSNTFAQYKFAGNLLKSYSPFINDYIMLNLIDQGEEELNKNYLCTMSEISKNVLEFIDLNNIFETRKQNAAVIHNELKKIGICHIYKAHAVPLFIPIFLDKDKRGKVRKTLFNKNIFCPIHWPWKSKELNGHNELYETELSIICDQRYTVVDMKQIVEIINGCKDN